MFLFRVLPAASKHVPHQHWVGSDAIRDTIDGTKLRRKEAVVTDLEERLAEVGHFHSIGILEVGGDIDGLAILGECTVLGVQVKADFPHNVGSLVAPLSNDALPSEFLQDLGLSVLAVAIKDLVDPLKTGASGHEFVDVVDDQAHA